MAKDNRTILLSALKAQLRRLQKLYKKRGKDISRYFPKDAKALIKGAKTILLKEGALASSNPAGQTESQPPYPDYATFKQMVMPHIIKRIKEIADDGKNPRAKVLGRKNVTVRMAYLSFLGYSAEEMKGPTTPDDDVILAAFNNNEKIEQYLQLLFKNYRDQLNEFSIKRYAYIAGNDIWSFIILYNAPIKEVAITKYTLGQINPRDVQLSSELEKFKNKRLIPGKFKRMLDEYQALMLEKQPAGFVAFVRHWRDIIQHIIDYQINKAPNSDRASEHIDENIRRMLKIVVDLLATEEYFSYSDYMNREKIQDAANPENRKIPKNADRKVNRKKGNISDTTGFIFNGEYMSKIPDPDVLVSEFNKLNVPFKPVPLLPSHKPEQKQKMSKKEFQQWLNNSSKVDGDVNELKKNLYGIASYLNANPNQVINIHGTSNYGIVDGNISIPVQIAKARAQRIATILTVEYRIPANQVTTSGEYHSDNAIGITITLKK